MAFLQVRVYHYRNLKDETIDLSARKVFLVGDNAQGKTNLLEALYFLSFGSSFRGARDSELVRHGQGEFSVIGTVVTGRNNHRIQVSCRDRVRRIEIDANVLHDRRDLIHIHPCIVFRHDDLTFAVGAPEVRRVFLDQTISLVDIAYIDILRQYRRVLRQRNEALRRGETSLLDTYDEQLVHSGVNVQRARERFVTAIAPLVQRLFATITQNAAPLQFSYRPSWVAAEQACEQLYRRRNSDLQMGTTTCGPHRDRVRFALGDQEFARIASTGQVRLLSLILRSAQATYVIDNDVTEPVLLFDDVLLELDPERRQRFVASLPQVRQQIFTFLPGEPYDGYRGDDTLVYSVTDGVFERT